MSAVFIQAANRIDAIEQSALNVIPVIPAGNYVIKFDKMRGCYYLETVAGFTKSTKVYGDAIKNANRIITTFKERTGKNTSVMLVGEKGSGKTLLAREISIRLADEGVPTLIVNEPFTGDTFNQFIQSISQNCVILFDEFEKVYDSEAQEHILTLLDGVYSASKWFILTCNYKHKVDHNLRNRPGRIFYMIDFDGLDVTFIREYCDDVLIDKSKTDGVVIVSSLFPAFNFDMLKAIVEEMNRYGETAKEVIKLVNAKPTLDTRDSKFSVNVFKDNELVATGKVYYNPSDNDTKSFWCEFESEEIKTKYKDLLHSSDIDSNDGSMYVELSTKNIVSIDPIDSKFTYINDAGFTIVTSPIRQTLTGLDRLLA